MEQIFRKRNPLLFEIILILGIILSAPRFIRLLVSQSITEGSTCQGFAGHVR